MKRAKYHMMLVSLSLILIGSSVASPVYAHSGAKGVVKERMALMKGLADAMKVMGPMFKGEASFAPDVVADQARLLVDYANKIPELTPTGSNEHPSEALPAIWQGWDGYVAGAEQLAKEARGLIDVASNGADQAEARAQYVKVGKTCGTCHDRFRKPKE